MTSGCSLAGGGMGTNVRWFKRATVRDSIGLALCAHALSTSELHSIQSKQTLDEKKPMINNFITNLFLFKLFIRHIKHLLVLLRYVPILILVNLKLLDSPYFDFSDTTVQPAQPKHFLPFFVI